MVPLKSIIFSKGWSHVPFRDHVSNENKPGCLGYIGFIGDEILPNYTINHEMRISIKQPVFHGM